MTGLVGKKNKNVEFIAELMEKRRKYEAAASSLRQMEKIKRNLRRTGEKGDRLVRKKIEVSEKTV